MSVRRTTSLVLSLALSAAPGLSHAQNLSAAHHISSSEIGTGADHLSESLKTATFPTALVNVDAERSQRLAIKEMIREKGLGTVEHIGSTMVLIWMISVIAGIVQEYQLAPLSDDKPDPLKVMKDSADHVVNDVSFYASFLSSGVTGLATAYPVKRAVETFMQPVIQGGRSALVYGNLLGLVTNIGWEGGNRLIMKSIADIALTANTPAERAAAERDIQTALHLRFFKQMRYGGTPDENRVFGLVLNNALERLMFFKDSSKTLEVVQETIRLNLKGNFTVMTLSFLTTGTLASGIASAAVGAGLLTAGLPVTAIGFSGALAGGLFAHYAPDKYKQGVTDGIIRTRTYAASNHLSLNLDRLKALAAVMGDWNRPLDTAGSTKQMAEILTERRGWRQTYQTALFEQVYDAILAHQTASGDLDRSAGAPGDHHRKSQGGRDHQEVRQDRGQIASTGFVLPESSAGLARPRDGRVERGPLLGPDQRAGRQGPAARRRGHHGAHQQGCARDGGRSVRGPVARHEDGPAHARATDQTDQERQRAIQHV